MRYFILSTPGRPDEVARQHRRSVASYYEPESQKWIMDPLLAVEILAGDDWRPVDIADLPPGLPDVVVETPKAPRSRSMRRGRHSDK